MNLKELKESVDLNIESLPNSLKPEEVQVLVNLNESSIGARASTKVKYTFMGIDWEYGQFRIETDKKIVSKGNRIDDIKEVICKKFEGKNYYVCSTCGSKINKNDRFCKYCGQKLK